MKILRSIFILVAVAFATVALAACSSEETKTTPSTTQTTETVPATTSAPPSPQPEVKKASEETETEVKADIAASVANGWDEESLQAASNGLSRAGITGETAHCFLRRVAIKLTPEEVAHLSSTEDEELGRTVAAGCNE